MGRYAVLAFICVICFYIGLYLGSYITMQEALIKQEETRINTERVLKEAAKEFDKRERAYIKTADFQFTRCIGEGDFWCLSTDEYIKFIMQLSMRRNCE